MVAGNYEPSFKDRLQPSLHRQTSITQNILIQKVDTTQSGIETNPDSTSYRPSTTTTNLIIWILAMKSGRRQPHPSSSSSQRMVMITNNVHHCTLLLLIGKEASSYPAATKNVFSTRCWILALIDVHVIAMHIL